MNSQTINYGPSLFGQEGWILASFSFSVHKHAELELGQYTAISTEHCSLIVYANIWYMHFHIVQ